MMFNTHRGSGARRRRARAVLRLIGLAATYQRPGMPVEHIPAIAARTSPGPGEYALH